MSVSRGLRRLLRIRNLEEEQRRLALDSAVAELARLEAARAAAVVRACRGRGLVRVSAESGEWLDRWAGIAEQQTAGVHAEALAPRIADSQLGVAALRQEFLNKRVERRQAETLIEEAEARDEREGARREQQSLDDWFGNRLHGEEPGAAEKET